MDGHKRILWIVGGGGNGLEGEGGEGGQNYFLRKSTSNSTNSKLKVMNGVNKNNQINGGGCHHVVVVKA